MIDIKIYDGEGNIYQPQDGAINVDIRSESLAASDKVSIYHIGDGSNKADLVGDACINKNKV